MLTRTRLTDTWFRFGAVVVFYTTRVLARRILVTYGIWVWLWGLTAGITEGRAWSIHGW